MRWLAWWRRGACRVAGQGRHPAGRSCRSATGSASAGDRHAARLRERSRQPAGGLGGRCGRSSTNCAPSRGGRDGHPGRCCTLGQYLQHHWLTVTLPQRVAAGRLAPGTLDSYRDNCERHIIPHLGNEKLAQLGAVRLRRWLLELQTTPSARQRHKLRDGETELPPPETLSARTVAYCHAILRNALNDATSSSAATWPCWSNRPSSSARRSSHRRKTRPESCWHTRRVTACGPTGWWFSPSGCAAVKASACAGNTSTSTQGPSASQPASSASGATRTRRPGGARAS